MGTLTPQNNGLLYSNTVIGTLDVDEWAVTFGSARRGLGGLPRPLSAVLNVTAHPSTVSVPTSYCSMWHYNCLCTLKVKSIRHPLYADDTWLALKISHRKLVLISDADFLCRLRCFCWHSERCPAPHCRVLPLGEFNDMIPDLLTVYSKSFVTIAVSVPP